MRRSSRPVVQDSAPATKDGANHWSALAKRQVRAAPPHIGVSGGGGSSGIGGGCGSPNAASAADMAP